MSPNSISTFTYRNPASFGIYSITKREKIRKNRFHKGKFTFWVAFVIFVFFTILIILLVLDILNSTKTIKNMKKKRFAQSNDLDSYESLKPVQQEVSFDRMTSDVQIVPEMSDNRRMSRYQNHRYDAMESKDKIYEKMMRDVYVENGWYPKPLNGKGGGGSLNNIQDILSRGRTSGEEGRKRSKQVLSSPMLLEGVYIRSNRESVTDDMEDKEDEDNYNYLKQINDMMQSSSVDDEDKATWIATKGFRGHGSPFRKPPKAVKQSRQQYQGNHSKRKNHSSKSELAEEEANPITILLDFRSERGDNEMKGEFLKKGKVKDEIIYIPINSGNAFHESMVGSETKLPTNSKHLKKKILNNMIIKLNLYPRGRRTRGGHGSVNYSNLGETVRQRREKKMAERRTFGLFSKHKKKKGHLKKCPIFKVKAQGHTIKAKWKDENGDWIHSEHVVVNHSGDD